MAGDVYDHVLPANSNQDFCHDMGYTHKFNSPSLHSLFPYVLFHAKIKGKLLFLFFGDFWDFTIQKQFLTVYEYLQTSKSVTMQMLPIFNSLAITKNFKTTHIPLDSVGSTYSATVVSMKFTTYLLKFFYRPFLNKFDCHLEKKERNSKSDHYS